MHAQRAAQQLATAQLSVAVAPTALPVATAVPMTATPTILVAAPTVSSAPVLYSHDAMPQLYRPAAVAPTADVEMRPVAAMYPAVMATNNGYARVDQSEV